jgi:hypothetical protein
MAESSVGDGRGLASRFRRIEPVDAGLAGEPDAEVQREKDKVLWLDLARAGTQLALAAATGDLSKVVGEASLLVGALLDVQDAQVRLLKSIDDNVKLLVAEPFEDGCLQLQTARRYVERSPQTSDPVAKAVKHVETAQDRFYTARTLVTEPMDQVVVELHIAVTYLLLNDQGETQHWLAQAYGKAWQQAHELAEKTGNTKVIKGRGIAQAATAYFTLGASAVYLAGKKVKRTHSNKRAQDGLRGVLPLVRCIASLHVASGGDPTECPALELVQVKKDSYELVEAPI